MQKFISYLFLTSALVSGINPLKADDWDFWEIQGLGGSTYKINQLNSATLDRTTVATENLYQTYNFNTSYVDQFNNLIFQNPVSSGVVMEFNSLTNSLSYKIGGDAHPGLGTAGAIFPRRYINNINDDLQIKKGERDLTIIKDGIEIGIGDNPTTINQTGISVEGGNLLKKQTDGSVQIGADGNDIDVVEDGLNIDGVAVITKNADGSIQIGADGNDIDITAEGLNVDGNPLITQKENGEIHIGKNSLITTKEEKTLSDGTKVQPLYAEDGDGNRIPINIDGSKLLIDGVEVISGGDNAQITTNKNNISTNKANIKNLGEGVAGSTALTAALSALPQTSKESKLSCGVGTGAYSSRYALGFGCASKVNERVDINAGGSYVFGGSKSYGGGTLDSGVVKAGFVFKLGELKKPTQISMKDNEKMETKILLLEENNNKIISQNKDLKEQNKSIISKNQNLENTLSTLMARLKRLEKIASRDIKSQDLELIKN